MRDFSPFFGEIVGKNDIVFMNQGFREGIVQTNNILTNNLGGIVEGLNVTTSPDLKSILVSPGVFYTSGIYSENNNQGGGERGQLFVQKTFTSLPTTISILNQQSYLLVYAQLTTSNINPDPTKFQILETSKNLQTGENVPTREYPSVNIVVSNPVLLTSAQTIEGVPLALLQVDSNGVITNLDLSIRRNYTIGGVIDVVNQSILDAGVPDSFITNRMMGTNQIDGTKFLDNSIITQKIEVWDGIGDGFSTSGTGINNAQIKGGAITESLVNYSGSLVRFSNRNRMLNSSFEIGTGLDNWITASGTGSGGVNSTSVSSDPTCSKYGNMVARLNGSINIVGSTQTSTFQEISQVTTFEGNIANMPVSAFFWAKQPTTPTNFSISGTTGLKGTLEFLAADSSVQQTVSFGPVSGNTTNYILYSTSAPIIYTGNIPVVSVNYKIGGNFNNIIYVDGVFLGTTSILPEFDISPSEYTALNVSALVDNTLPGTKILDNSMPGSKITNNSIPSAKLSGGITGNQIASQTILGSNVKNGEIGQNQLSPSYISGLISQIVSQTASTLGPQIARAWALFNAVNTSGIPNPTNVISGYNVDSITSNGIFCTVNFTPGTFTDTNYAVFITYGNDAGLGGIVYPNTKTSNSIMFGVTNSSTTNITNAGSKMSIMAFHL